MATKIEWTDETWNPVTGCVKVSPGCKHCYAETFAERFRGVIMPGGKLHVFNGGFDPELRPERLGHPLKWRTPRRVFVNGQLPRRDIQGLEAIGVLANPFRENLLNWQGRGRSTSS